MHECLNKYSPGVKISSGATQTGDARVTSKQAHVYPIVLNNARAPNQSIVSTRIPAVMETGLTARGFGMS
jgi:hypothetical protein